MTFSADEQISVALLRSKPRLLLCMLLSQLHNRRGMHCHRSLVAGSMSVQLGPSTAAHIGEHLGGGRATVGHGMAAPPAAAAAVLTGSLNSSCSQSHFKLLFKLLTGSPACTQTQSAHW
jgi:hypothetical protein